jgi:hypothetical protein
MNDIINKNISITDSFCTIKIIFIQFVKSTFGDSSAILGVALIDGTILSSLDDIGLLFLQFLGLFTHGIILVLADYFLLTPCGDTGCILYHNHSTKS